MTGVEGFAIHRAKGRNCDLYVLFRQGQRLGLFNSEGRCWERARQIRDKEFLSEMVPAAHGTSPRLVRP